MKYDELSLCDWHGADATDADHIRLYLLHFLDIYFLQENIYFWRINQDKWLIIVLISSSSSNDDFLIKSIRNASIKIKKSPSPKDISCLLQRR